jgi:hypothetical protein
MQKAGYTHCVYLINKNLQYLKLISNNFKSLDGSGSKVTDYRHNDLGLLSTRGRDFALLHNVCIEISPLQLGIEP